MKLKSKLMFIGASTAALASIVLGAVHANPLYFLPTAQTATATTSPSYMTAGKATTTLSFDSYSAGQPNGTNGAALFIQLVASSTLTTLNTDIEYSQDGIDWYQDGGTVVDNFSTTTKPFSIGAVNEYQFTFASSTAGLGAVSSSNSITTRIVNLKTPVRYVRAVFTLPTGSTAGAVWAQFVPKRERTQ